LLDWPLVIHLKKNLNLLFYECVWQSVTPGSSQTPSEEMTPITNKSSLKNMKGVTNGRKTV
jgi:hypothetical protein